MKLVGRRPFGYANPQGTDSITQAYYLTRDGAQLLREIRTAHGLPDELRWTRGVADLAPIFSNHFLEAHDALIAFEAAGVLDGLDLHDWQDEGYTKAWTGVQPDGYIFLSDGATDLTALIEVELTSKVDGAGYASFTKKIPRYLELLHQDTFPFPPIVFTLAKTQARAQSLKEATERVGGRSNFWFGTTKMSLDPATFFVEEWLVATAETRTIAGKLSRG